MGTKTVISKHNRARIDYAFELVFKAFSVTTISYAETKALVLRSLAGEFDGDIILTSTTGVRVPLTAAPEFIDAPSTRHLADEVWAHGEALKTIASKLHDNLAREEQAREEEALDRKADAEERDR